MDKQILNELFAKDKLWFNENIHNGLITKMFASLIEVKAKRNYDRSEYDLQSVMGEFLVDKLANTDFSSKKEWRKFDCAITDKNNKKAFVLYELKTFIKEKEKTLNFQAIYKDILKLAIYKKLFPYIEAYIIVAGRTNIIRTNLENRPNNLPNKFIEPRSRSSRLITKKDFNFLKSEKELWAQIKKNAIFEVSISPSRWKNYDNMCVASWKITKVKSSKLY